MNSLSFSLCMVFAMTSFSGRLFSELRLRWVTLAFAKNVRAQIRVLRDFWLIALYKSIISSSSNSKSLDIG